MSPRGWFLFTSLGVIWGVPYMFIRIAVGEFDPLIVAAGRTFIGALLLLPIALHRRAIGPALRAWPWLLVFTGVEIVGPWLLLGHAETVLTSATTGLLLAVTPLVSIVVAVTMRVDHVDRIRLLGLAIGLAGVVSVVGFDIDLTNLPAVAAVGATAVGYALGPMIIARKLADVPPIGVITTSLAIATIIYAPAAAFVWPTRWPTAPTVSIVVLGVICTAIAFVFLFALVAEAGPTRTSVITYLNPVVAIALGVAVLGEPLTAGMLVGFGFVLVGSVLATRRSRRADASSPEPAAA